MAEKNNHNRLHVREPLSDTQMLMYISIGIFAAMYIAAMLTLKGGFLKPQMIFDLINDNAALIIISCALTIVMIGGGINISVGGVIGLTVMACALFLNGNSIENSALSIVLTLLLALGIGLGFGLLALYGVVSLSRTILEPQLVGKQLGLHPLLTLIAFYSGYRLLGLAGMILFPLAATVAAQLSAPKSVES